MGFSVITVNVDTTADCSGCVCLQNLSPTDQLVIYTSSDSSSIEPGGSQSIDLADILHPSAQYFYFGGEQTRMLPRVKVANGKVILGLASRCTSKAGATAICPFMIVTAHQLCGGLQVQQQPIRVTSRLTSIDRPDQQQSYAD